MEDEPMHTIMKYRAHGYEVTMPCWKTKLVHYGAKSVQYLHNLP
jgi:hypothetical protein